MTDDRPSHAPGAARPLASFAVMTAVFLGMDAAWLTLTGDRLYRPLLGPILTPQPSLAAAVGFYAIYLTGLHILVVRPTLAGGRLSRAALKGALFGLVAYSTYDLTNQATLKAWPSVVTACDLAWGTIVTGTASAAGWIAGHAPRRRRGQARPG